MEERSHDEPYAGAPNPEAVLPALDEGQLRTLRRVGREWGTVCGDREVWRRALPVDPDLGEYPDRSEIRPTRFGRFVPVLLRLIYTHHLGAFDQAGAPLLAIFPLTTVFLVSSIALLRERTGGTLERLLATPLGRRDLIVGYARSLGLLASGQAVVVSALTLGPLGLHVRDSAAVVVVLVVCVALLGMGLGLLASAFARSEFQVVQFLPLNDLPPTAAVRSARGAQPDARSATRHLRRAAHVLRRGWHAPPDPPSRSERSCPRRYRDRSCVRGLCAGARRGNAAKAHRLAGSSGLIAASSAV